MKWFLKCIRNYVTFKGRARRSEYWNFVLFMTILLIIAKIVDLACSSSIIASIVALFLFLPWLAVQVRRLHDTGRSGLRILWYYLTNVIWVVVLIVMAGFSIFINPNPEDLMALGGGFLAIFLVGLLVCFIWQILFLVWSCINGDSGANKYGDDPKTLSE
ncbi:MAG: DUF805 domain-containing protein [Alistipes sp.]